MVAWALSSAPAIPAGATTTAQAAATEATRVANVVKVLDGRTLRPLSVLDCFTHYIAAGNRFVPSVALADSPISPPPRTTIAASDRAPDQRRLTCAARCKTSR